MFWIDTMTIKYLNMIIGDYVLVSKFKKKTGRILLVRQRSGYFISEIHYSRCLLNKLRPE